MTCQQFPQGLQRVVTDVFMVNGVELNKCNEITLVVDFEAGTFVPDPNVGESGKAPGDQAAGR